MNSIVDLNLYEITYISGGGNKNRHLSGKQQVSQLTMVDHLWNYRSAIFFAGLAISGGVSTAYIRSYRINGGFMKSYALLVIFEAVTFVVTYLIVGCNKLLGS
jgi:hypothetical protein